MSQALPRILHIEDDALIAKLVATRLKPRAEVTWVTNTDDARAQLDRTDVQYALVLVDIELKGSKQSGSQFVQSMLGKSDSTIATPEVAARATARIPYILLSAVITPVMEENAKLWGVHALLHKPIRFGALEAALTAAGIPLPAAPTGPKPYATRKQDGTDR